MLQVLDNHWKEHLAAMDYLRQSVGLRGYAQKNPKQEFKREAFEMFQGLLDRVKFDVTNILLRLQIQENTSLPPQRSEEEAEAQMEFQHPQAHGYDEAPGALDGGSPVESEEGVIEPPAPFKREGRKVGRNEPCPCGSGKKYKQCHGKLS